MTDPEFRAFYWQSRSRMRRNQRIATLLVIVGNIAAIAIVGWWLPRRPAYGGLMTGTYGGVTWPRDPNTGMLDVPMDFSAPCHECGEDSTEDCPDCYRHFCEEHLPTCQCPGTAHELCVRCTGLTQRDGKWYCENCDPAEWSDQ